MSSSTHRKRLSLELLEQFETLARAESNELERFALSQLSAIWRNARSSNSWWNHYLPRWDNVFDPKDGLSGLLSRLPILTRKQVQDSSDFSAVWLSNSSPSQYGFASTSGSTGKPVRVLKHGPSYDIGIHAASLQETIWHDRDMSLRSLHLRSQKTVQERAPLNEPFSFIWDDGESFFLRTADTSPRAVLEFIVRNNISNVFGGSNFLRFLAKEQLSQPVANQVRHFINWAEALNPSTRELLTTAFDAKVADRYSSEELGLIAIQCPVHTHLHALQYLNWVEIVDDSGAPCQPGTPGRLLVTSLRNFAQPLIRYELGDIASWGQSCDAGITLPVIEPLITRERESLVLENGSWRQPNASGCVLAKENLVRDFQVYRFENALLVIYNALEKLTPSQENLATLDLQKRFASKDNVFFVLTQDADFQLHKRKDFVRMSETLDEQSLENVLTKVLNGTHTS